MIDMAKHYLDLKNPFLRFLSFELFEVLLSFIPNPCFV
jgi:hypothetical protein